jgi:hypothetical protein
LATNRKVRTTGKLKRRKAKTTGKPETIGKQIWLESWSGWNDRHQDIDGMMHPASICDMDKKFATSKIEQFTFRIVWWVPRS